MAKITIRFGIDNELKTDVANGTNVGQIVGNAGYQAALGFAANDQAKVNGYTANVSQALYDGDVVSIEKAACTKA